MAFEDNRARPAMSHHVILEEREQLVISGVEEVESFDESTIFLLPRRAVWRSRGRSCTSRSCPWTAAT